MQTGDDTLQSSSDSDRQRQSISSVRWQSETGIESVRAFEPNSNVGRRKNMHSGAPWETLLWRTYNKLSTICLWASEEGDIWIRLILDRRAVASDKPVAYAPSAVCLRHLMDARQHVPAVASYDFKHSHRRSTSSPDGIIL
jgi:hypothetical protein